MKIIEILKTQKSYFKWRLERIKRIEKRFPEIFDVKNKKILDVGCGAEAPLSYYLSETKDAIVYAGDITQEIVMSAKNFAKKAKISLFCSENLPFEDNEFDNVYLFDVLEHVKSPFLSIKEAKRVVKKNGFIFVEFSPYYAYPSGHHLYSLGFPKGFFPFQFMPISLVRSIVLNSELNTKDTPSYIFNEFKKLNKLDVGGFKKIIKKIDLTLFKQDSFIMLPHKEISINMISKIPLIREFVTMSYSSILKKR